jgi:hypothetical protein
MEITTEDILEKSRWLKKNASDLELLARQLDGIKNNDLIIIENWNDECRAITGKYLRIEREGVSPFYFNIVLQGAAKIIKDESIGNRVVAYDFGERSFIIYPPLTETMPKILKGDSVFKALREYGFSVWNFDVEIIRQQYHLDSEGRRPDLVAV